MNIELNLPPHAIHHHRLVLIHLPPQKEKKNTRMRKNVSDANAYNRLKREMEKQIAITTKQNDKINQLEMKVKSLQKKLLIERNENEHLKKRIHETIQTNEMADAYLRSLLQNRPK